MLVWNTQKAASAIDGIVRVVLLDHAIALVSCHTIARECVS